VWTTAAERLLDVVGCVLSDRRIDARRFDQGNGDRQPVSDRFDTERVDEALDGVFGCNVGTHDRRGNVGCDLVSLQRLQRYVFVEANAISEIKEISPPKGS